MHRARDQCLSGVHVPSSGVAMALWAAMARSLTEPPPLPMRACAITSLPCLCFELRWPCRAFELKWLLNATRGRKDGNGNRFPKLSLPPPFFYLLRQMPDAPLHLLDAFCAFLYNASQRSLTSSISWMRSAFFVQRFPTFTLHFFSATSKILCCWRRSLALPLVDCPHVA